MINTFVKVLINMININSKLPSSKESIFSIMSRMAVENNAINLSQGFPGFDIDGELIDLVSKYMKMGFNQYAPMAGVPDLRKAISKMHLASNGYEYNWENEITITAGATQGLFTSISTLIEEGDEVIIFEPAYDSYVPDIQLAGGKPIYITLEYPNYQINWEDVNKRISSKTKMIILNNPHNPTGSVLDDDDLKELSKIVKGSNIIILSDEVYQHIIFDQKKHCSVANYPELIERSIIVGSFGKSLHATGWKIGYLLAPKAITKAIRSVHQWVVYAVNTPIQHAIAEYISKPDIYSGVSVLLQEKRDLFLELMKNSRFKAIPSKGTYFQLMDYSDISDKNDIEFTEWLAKDKKVAAIPVSVFFHEKKDNKVIRFCFAKDNEELEAAAKLLCDI